ncbi:MAG: YvcK family protein [Clostridiaceae bacterium]|nr:YvcK family protein [Clostridiaceae bacterium]
MTVISRLKKLFHNLRWILMDLIGVFCISSGMFIIYIGQGVLNILLFSISVILGCIFIYISVQFISMDLYHELVDNNFRNPLVKSRLKSLLREKRMLGKGPKIVVLGGGTGLSTMLRGLKSYSSNITAIVTVADDGGGSGILRQDLGILPPGDIRNCILALADTEPVMEKLLQYRFQDGMLKGQSFGNLFLAAMDGISSSFEEAVRRMSDVLAVTGRVLPVTLQDIKLCAELDDGFTICGESNISRHNDFHKGKIKRVYMEPKDVKPLKEAIDAINDADIIVLGPGSLYTSIMPNLLVNGICDEIKASKAVKLYVCNVMTQPGETEEYSVSDHIKAIEKHSFKGIVDYCIVNTEDIPGQLKKKYEEDGASTVRLDPDYFEGCGVKVVKGSFVTINNNYVRHDTKKLAQAIIDTAFDAFMQKDRKVETGFYNVHVKNKLKKNVG